MTGAAGDRGPAPRNAHALEEGAGFTPAFDDAGLIACVTVEAISGDVLMVAYMNAEALRITLDTRQVTYWSRSRQTLWRKGETSGQLQRLIEMRTDCDQDALLLRVEVGGDGGCCHTGRRSCFYRRVLSDGPNGSAALVKDELTGSGESTTTPTIACGQAEAIGE